MMRRRGVIAAVAFGVAAIVWALVLWPAVPHDEEQAAENDLGRGSMFDRIAGRYDVANRVMSLGLDRGWRRALVDALGIQPGDRVLDLATGTADVAILEGLAGGTVRGVDPSARMLDVGRRKVAAAGLSEETVRLQLGDATQLTEVATASADKISIAFGIRNIPDPSRALREMRRVAAPNATLAVLEFCEPTTGPLAPLARLFIRYVVPRLGALLSGAKWAEYRHLQASIAAFPPPREFADLVRRAGFEFRDDAAPAFFACGSVALYVATTPVEEPLLPNVTMTTTTTPAGGSA